MKSYKTKEIYVKLKEKYYKYTLFLTIKTSQCVLDIKANYRGDHVKQYTIPFFPVGLLTIFTCYHHFLIFTQNNKEFG